MTPQEFVDRWRGSTSTEKQAYQQHFLDLCNLVDHPTPAYLDRKNKFFTFEAGATKQSGGQGWADVWFKGHFAIEYKGPDGNLDKAYSQLLQYRESLENPPLLIVSNIQTILIHTNFTGTIKRIVTVTLDDILKPEGLQAIRNIFYNPEAFRPELTAAQVTEAAATKFGHLAAHLAKWGYNPHDIAHYLIRLLFCLFAEDIDLLPRELFTRLVDTGRRDSGRFNRQIKLLFRAMTDGSDFGEHPIRYFDGGLFDGDSALELDVDALYILQGITALDWSSIEPAILGTLFVRSLDPTQRAKLGAQYTSKEDILLIVEPVLMAPLRREWVEVKAKAKELAQRRDTAANRAVATKTQNELRELVMGFVQKVRAMRVLDPACGSGNFLYISLRLLMDLEKEIINFCGEVGLQPFFPEVNPEQLYGIEINDYAHELAQATVWIGYLQWLHENGYGFPSEPILKPLDNIKQMDAILAYDADGKPVEPEWPEADVIVGNPPFLGGNRVRNELGDTYINALFGMYDDRVGATADLVCYWFERARGMVEIGKAKRVGLLATNSIRGGVNRNVLERIKQTGEIFWAMSDRDWLLEGAAVRVSMIGFDNGATTIRELDGIPVQHINSNLTGSFDLTSASPLPENAHLAFRGNQKGGPFDIPQELAEAMLLAGNASGRSNSDVVKPLVNGLDITRRPRRVWIIDFGTSMSVEDASQYELPYRYVLDNVYPLRQVNNRKAYRDYWWIHVEPRPNMRRSIAKMARFIVTPHVSKYRVFAWVRFGTVPDHELIVVARGDDYFFGVLQSKLHELWALRMGTSLEDRPRYTPTTTFDTYPFPWPPGKEPQGDPRVQAIGAAAKELVELRDAWLNPPDIFGAELDKRTLTNLYNLRPDWLEAAHKRLDAAVFDAYGWPHDLTDEEILARLLALNLERAGK